MKNPWSKLVLASLLFSLTSACLLMPTVTPIPPLGGPTLGSVPGGATQAPQTGSPAPAPTQPAGNQAPSGASLSLQVLSPQDGAVVNTAQVQVSGTASPGDVVSINDDVVLVGADGQFQTTITLTEGPNLIEVIASDDAGNEKTMELTVTYAP